MSARGQSKRPVHQLAPRPVRAKHFGITPAVFYSIAGFLLLSNAVTLVGLLMAPDISRLVSGQSARAFEAYEDRIDNLRLEIDRLHSRQYAQAGDINLQLQEISQQQDVLLEQHNYVKVLVEKAAELGIDTEPATKGLITSELAPAPAVTGDPQGIFAIKDSVEKMMGESRVALAALSETVTDRTDEIVTELHRVGIEPPKVNPAADSDVGGPFIAARPDIEDDTGMVDEANRVIFALDRFKAARVAVSDAPVHQPLKAGYKISSGFGNRPDPFFGKLAFHPGLDMAAPSGTSIVAAGAGVVSYAGPRSGYGNVVEITHASGLVSRYAHMSLILAKEGDKVLTGTLIGRVGSTGRSTGPHLHFEVRRGDTPLNPSRFLAAGIKLAEML